ncbi:hypothetical protein Tco_0640135 [Tanacetum coccineum]
MIHILLRSGHTVGFSLLTLRVYFWCRSGTLVAAKGLVDSIEVCYKSLGRSMELKVEYPFALNVRYLGMAMISVALVEGVEVGNAQGKNKMDVDRADIGTSGKSNVVNEKMNIDKMVAVRRIVFRRVLAQKICLMGGSTDSEMINSLLQDLLSERDNNALLEKQIQEAEEKIKKLDKEHEAIIEIFSDERSRQYDMESNLRKKWQVRRQINTI